MAAWLQDFAQGLTLTLVVQEVADLDDEEFACDEESDLQEEGDEEALEDEADLETWASPAPQPGALEDALRRALWSRDETSALQLLSNRRLSRLNDRDESKDTLLHRAIRGRLSQVALALLARPDFLKVNARSSGGWAPLHVAAHVAARVGDLAVCQALCARSDFAPGKDLTEALRIARGAGHREVSELLQGRAEGRSQTLSSRRS